MRLHHVQVCCPRGGEEVARAFWADVVGLAEVAKPPALAPGGGAWFTGGQVEIHVGVEEPFSPALKAHPALAVVDADALAGRLEAAGHPVSWDEAIPGRRRFHTADGHGNRLEIIADEGAEQVPLT